MSNKKKSGLGSLAGIIIAGVVLIAGVAVAMWLIKNLIGIIAGAVVILVIIFVLIFALARRSSTIDASEKKVTKTLTQEQNERIAQGRESLMELRRSVLKIHDNNIRGKANEVCSELDKIFQTLKEQPDEISKTRQLIDYYIPTTKNVVNNYVLLTENGNVNEETSGNVYKFLDEVNAAMGEFHGKLFSNEKLDMDVDMEAMTMILKQDGLLDNEDLVK